MATCQWTRSPSPAQRSANNHPDNLSNLSRPVEAQVGFFFAIVLSQDHYCLARLSGSFHPPRSMLRPFPTLALIAAFLAPLQAAKPDKPKKDKEFIPGKAAFSPDPKTPAFDPAQVKPEHLDTSMFKIPEGLEITVWATSPMLFNPSNMDVDAAGRIWVAEGINYRRHSGRSREGDAIRVLQDTDGDGKADSSHVFVREKELECPLGVAVFDNVVLVSNTPNLIMYTDVNRDLKFDPAVDRREVLLTGFEQAQHDHSLHSVYAGPDGRWYFSNGNCGAKFSDKSGNTFRIGGGYLNNSYMGEKSDDGHVYVGGFTASIDPSGHNARILGYNYRNSFEGVRNSLGDMYLNDNDDPPACRVSHLIEGGSFGFFSPDGKRQWRADKRPGQSIPTAEWRQEDPGSIPAGDVYGGGSPTGVAFYENGALGDKWKAVRALRDALWHNALTITSALGVDIDSMQVEVHIGVPKPHLVDKAAVLANADKAGVHRGDDYVDLVGVRFMLV